MSDGPGQWGDPPQQPPQQPPGQWGQGQQPPGQWGQGPQPPMQQPPGQWGQGAQPPAQQRPGWSPPGPGGPPQAGQPPVGFYGADGRFWFYGSFGARVGAALLDALFVMAALFAIIVASTILGLGLGVIEELIGTIVSAMIMFGGYIGLIVLFLFLEAGPYGQTPGKFVVGIRVVDGAGYSIGKGMAVGRYFAKMLSGLPCYLGYLWPLWDPQRRTFHDIILNTRVVVVERGQGGAPSLIAAIKGPFVT